MFMDHYDLSTGLLRGQSYLPDQGFDMLGHAPTNLEPTGARPITMNQRCPSLHGLLFQTQPTASHRPTSNIHLSNVESMSLGRCRGGLAIHHFRTDGCNSFQDRFGCLIRNIFGPVQCQQSTPSLFLHASHPGKKTTEKWDEECGCALTNCPALSYRQ